MHFLRDLPAILLTGLFTDWLDLPALVALDSASCSAESRKAFLCIFTSKESCFHQLPNPPVLHSNGVQWFMKRGAKIKRVVIGFKSSAVDVELFFKISGGSLNSLRMEYNSKYGYESFELQLFRDCEQRRALKAALLRDHLAVIAEICPHQLKTLVIADCGTIDGKSLGALLTRSSHTLKRFSIRRCDVSGSLDISEVPSLQMLHVSASSIDTDVVCQLISSSPDLRSFHCGHMYKKDDYFNALATHCPLLQVLSYESGRPSVASLVSVLRSCPAIEVVNTYGPEEERDNSDRGQHYATIMMHCMRLRAFCAGDRWHMVKFTRAELMAVATRVKDILHLYLVGLEDDQDTKDGILAMAPYCGSLVSVELSSYNRNIDYAVLNAFVSNLHSVEELCIYSHQNDDVLEVIAANCPLLRVLNLKACEGYTEKGLAAVALNCTAMELVGFGDERVLSPFGKILWKAMRPNLQFDDSGAQCRLWQNLLDVERDELVIW